MSGGRQRRPDRARKIPISPASGQDRSRDRSGLRRSLLMIKKKKGLSNGRSRLDRPGLGLRRRQSREDRGLAFPWDALR